MLTYLKTKCVINCRAPTVATKLGKLCAKLNLIRRKALVLFESHAFQLSAVSHSN